MELIHTRLSIILCATIFNVALLANIENLHAAFKVGENITLSDVLQRRYQRAGEKDYNVLMGLYQKRITDYTKTDNPQTKLLWTAMYIKDRLVALSQHPGVHTEIKAKMNDAADKLDAAIQTFPQESYPSWWARTVHGRCLPCQEFISNMEKFMNTRGVDIKEKAKEYSCGAFIIELNDELADVIHNPSQYTQE